MPLLSVLSALLLTGAAGISCWRGEAPLTVLVITWTAGWIAGLGFCNWLALRRAEAAQLRLRVHEARREADPR